VTVGLSAHDVGAPIIAKLVHESRNTAPTGRRLDGVVAVISTLGALTSNELKSGRNLPVKWQAK
jgi:hypothetical protein